MKLAPMKMLEPIASTSPIVCSLHMAAAAAARAPAAVGALQQRAAAPSGALVAGRPRSALGRLSWARARQRHAKVPAYCLGPARASEGAPGARAGQNRWTAAWGGRPCACDRCQDTKSCQISALRGGMSRHCVLKVIWESVDFRAPGRFLKAWDAGRGATMSCGGAASGGRRPERNRGCGGAFAQARVHNTDCKASIQILYINQAP